MFNYNYNNIFNVKGIQSPSSPEAFSHNVILFLSCTGKFDSYATNVAPRVDHGEYTPLVTTHPLTVLSPLSQGGVQKECLIVTLHNVKCINIWRTLPYQIDPIPTKWPSVLSVDLNIADSAELLPQCYFWSYAVGTTTLISD